MTDPTPAPLRRRARAVAGRLARAALRLEREPGRPDTSWARAEPNPEPAAPLDSFRFFAVLGTWYEADIVGATVRNAFEQGCERVYLVDNDSPDRTVAVAEAAGARLARSFHTEIYDETLRMRLMNDVVFEVSAEVAALDGDRHIWWLWLDADEFPHGPGGLTLREYLTTLDRRFRVVGTRFFNHYPDRVPEYVEDRHPLDYQPLCEEIVYPMCAEGHRKHPLQRWDADGPPITCVAGFHQASCPGVTLLEPTRPAFLHHFPFRVRATSEARLEALVGNTEGRAAGDTATHWHIHKRARQLDAVYRHDWKAVESLAPAGRAKGVHLQPWRRQVPDADVPCARW